MLDELPDQHQNLYLAIGFMAAQWAMAEYVFDHIIRHAHERYGGDAIQRSPPVSWKRKPAYLRQVFRANDELAHHSSGLEDLLKEASEIADMRNWCLHGIVTSLGFSQPLKMRKLVHAQEYQTAERPIRMERIEFVGHRATALAVNALFFGVQSVGIMPENEADDLISKFLSEHRAILPAGQPLG